MNNALKQLQEMTNKNSANLSSDKPQEKKKKFDFKDNIFSVKSWSFDGGNLRDIDYEITKSGVTQKGHVHYKVVFDNTKHHTDPWTFERVPEWDLVVLDGWDELPKKLYGYCRDVVREYDIKYVLKSLNDSRNLPTFALDKSLL